MSARKFHEWLDAVRRLLDALGGRVRPGVARRNRRVDQLVKYTRSSLHYGRDILKLSPARTKSTGRIILRETTFMKKLKAGVCLIVLAAGTSFAKSYDQERVLGRQIFPSFADTELMERLEREQWAREAANFDLLMEGQPILTKKGYQPIAKAPLPPTIEDRFVKHLALTVAVSGVGAMFGVTGAAAWTTGLLVSFAVDEFKQTTGR